MPYLPMDLPTDIIRRYYTKSCYKITSHAILTDGRTDGYYLSVLHRELRQNYKPCHTYRRIADEHDVGNYP
jgi:hypothetical protein